jgi:hypothetical protein
VRSAARLLLQGAVLHDLQTRTMVAPGRFELPTSGLGNRCSIQLSYGAMSGKYSLFNTLKRFVQLAYYAEKAAPEHEFRTCCVLGTSRTRRQIPSQLEAKTVSTGSAYLSG